MNGRNNGQGNWKGPDSCVIKLKGLHSVTGWSVGIEKFDCTTDKVIQFNALIASVKNLPQEWYAEIMAENGSTSKSAVKVEEALTRYFTYLSSEIPTVSLLPNSTSFKVVWRKFGCWCTCGGQSPFERCRCAQASAEKLLSKCKHDPECRRRKYTALPILRRARKLNLPLVLDDKTFQLRLDVFASRLCQHNPCWRVHDNRQYWRGGACTFLHRKDVVFAEQLVKMDPRDKKKHMELRSQKGELEKELKSKVSEVDDLLLHGSEYGGRVEVEILEREIDQLMLRLTGVRQEIANLTCEPKIQAVLNLASLQDESVVLPLGQSPRSSESSFDSFVNSLRPPSMAPAASSISVATSQFPVEPTYHCWERMYDDRNGREITKREIQRARKAACTRNLWQPANNGCWKVVFNEQVYIFDNDRYHVVTTYPLSSDTFEPSSTPSSSSVNIAAM